MMPLMPVILLSSAILAVLAVSAAVDNPPPPPPTPESAISELRTRVNDLLAKPQPPLFERNLRSILALAEQGFIRLSLRAPDHDAQAKEFVEYVTAAVEGLKGDAALPDSYLRNGDRSLVLARLSKIDGSLQYCMVSLPENWNPDKEYPLVVSLHGTGPSNPLAYSSGCLAPSTPGEKSTKRDLIYLSPWGRGNRGWINDSEADFWEALEDVKSFCKIDKERCYITGHSMGADGVWALVQRTPDMWAAAGMKAGSMGSAPLEAGLLPNIQNLPIHMWIGADDHLSGRNDSCKIARDALSAIGNNVEFVESIGVGHMPRSEDTASQIDWMLTHVRKRPSKFEFLIDTRLHRGVWGISVPRPPGHWGFLPGPKPHFSCSIEGGIVHIETKNADHLLVDLGPSGLEMTGDVEVFLNGKSVFKGAAPAEPLDLKNF